MCLHDSHVRVGFLLSGFMTEKEVILRKRVLNFEGGVKKQIDNGGRFILVSII